MPDNGRNESRIASGGMDIESRHSMPGNGHTKKEKNKPPPTPPQGERQEGRKGGTGRDVRMPSGRNYQEDSGGARDQRTERRKDST